MIRAGFKFQFCHLPSIGFSSISWINNIYQRGYPDDTMTYLKYLAQNLPGRWWSALSMVIIIMIISILTISWHLANRVLFFCIYMSTQVDHISKVTIIIYTNLIPKPVFLASASLLGFRTGWFPLGSPQRQRVHNWTHYLPSNYPPCLRLLLSVNGIRSSLSKQKSPHRNTWCLSLSHTHPSFVTISV